MKGIDYFWGHAMEITLVYFNFFGMSLKLFIF